MTNEEVRYIAVQKKPAINVFPDSFIATNKRLIICNPKNLGFSIDFSDFNWSAVHDVKLNEGFLGAEIKFDAAGQTYQMDYLPKNQARKLFTYCKEQNEHLIVKSAEVAAAITEDKPTQISDSSLSETPVELIENFEVTPEIPSLDVVSNLSPDAIFEKLQHFKKKMLDNGLISQPEYESLKKELLAKL